MGRWRGTFTGDIEVLAPQLEARKQEEVLLQTLNEDDSDRCLQFYDRCIIFNLTYLIV